MSIELATQITGVYRDTRTVVQKRQSDLFRTMGTLARTEGILYSLVNCHPGSNMPAVRLTGEQRKTLYEAAVLLGNLRRAAATEMNNLPSKKKLAALAKVEKS